MGDVKFICYELGAKKISESLRGTEPMTSGNRSEL